MDQHISGFDTNTDDSGQPPNHGVGPGLRLLLQSFLTSGWRAGRCGEVGS
jgi:hypothetical protein